jgi:hypothetical protein
MSTISIHRPQNLDGWRIVPITIAGDVAYHVLQTPTGYPYAQGTHNLCRAVLSMLKYDDDAEQVTERFLFHRVHEVF